MPSAIQLPLLEFDIKDGVEHETAAPPQMVRIAGRTLQPTAVFDTYWRFAAKRQEIYYARLAGNQKPWTDDPILARHRFTNCYRAADRVSQFLIKEVSYTGSQEWEEVFFRTTLFKFFNRISTWRLLQRNLSEIRWDAYSFKLLDKILGQAFVNGDKLYSAAYLVPPPALGEQRKHSNHLRLIEMMMTTGAPDRIANATTMKEAFEIIRSYPAIGDFLAYQYLIDLNYSPHINFSELDYVVAGPGAKDGIRKCFGRESDGIEADVIRYMTDSQEEHFDRLQLQFPGLMGRRLQLIDCQNLFCEVDKYARVAHPSIQGHSGRTRIKQNYRADHSPLTAWFPPKWGLNCEQVV